MDNNKLISENAYIKEKEFDFIKKEQNYAEQKINFLAYLFGILNTLIFTGLSLNAYFKLLTFLYLIILLIPIAVLLIGYMPRGLNQNSKFNFLSNDYIMWNEKNYLQHLEYQINLSRIIIEKKHHASKVGIFLEITSLIILLILIIVI